MEGRPIRVALIGAGFMSRGLANHIVNTTPGMSVVGVYNRGLQRAFDLCEYAELRDAVAPSTQQEVDFAIRHGKVVATEDAFLLARSSEVDVLVDVTGSVEFGARVALEAFRHGKDVMLLNAEIDATIGPILQVYAEKHGVILSACDGDEPGLQINLYRWVKGLGADAARHRQYQRTSGSLPQSHHAKRLRRKVGPEPRDGHEFCRRLQDQLRGSHCRQRDRFCRAFAGHVARKGV